MAIVNLLSVSAPGGLWGGLINWLSKGISSYAVVLIVLTLLVKVVLLPLDCVNKYTSKINSRKQAEIAPEIEKINKRYANNKELLNKKTMEAYKNHHYNIYGTCVTMLLYLVLTLVVFFTLFNSLNKMSAHKIYNEYTTLRSTYAIELGLETTATDEELVAAGTYVEGTTTDEQKQKIDNANKAVVAKYGEIKEGFLWIENIWRPDTSAKPILNYKSFLSNSKIKSSEVSESAYNMVMNPVKNEYSGWNGYFVLALLTAASTLGSFFINNAVAKYRAKRKGKVYIKSAEGGKTMLFIMPIIMGIFTLMYNAAFGLYILTGNLFTLITGPLITLLVEWLDERKMKKEQQKYTVSYSRK